MFGDSLTAGISPPSPDGPRQQVWDRLTDAEIDFTFVGTKNPPDSTVPENNCGAVAGWYSDLVNGLMETDLPAETPDIVCTLSGTNDVAVGAPLTNLNYWGGLIDKNIASVFRLRPTACVIVGTCPLYTNPALNARRLALNEYIAVYAAAHIRLGRRVIVADTANAYATSDDGVHPDAAGYEALGDVWADAILEAIARWGYS